MAQAGLELNLAASASQILGLHIPITLYTYGSVQTLTRVVKNLNFTLITLYFLACKLASMQLF